MKHLNIPLFLEDLYYDYEILKGLFTDIQCVLNEHRDAKLKQLTAVLSDKVTTTPYNTQNKKC